MGEATSPSRYLPLLESDESDAADDAEAKDFLPSSPGTLRWGRGFVVPTFFVNKEVVAMRDKYFEANGHVPVALCTGPAVLWALGAVANWFVLWISVPVLAYWLSTCPGEISGIAICDDTLIWIVFLCIGGVQCYIQAKCVSYVITPQVENTRPGFAIGPLKLYQYPFYVWFTAMSLLTLVSLADTVTNGELVGRVVRTSECSSATHFDAAWNAVMEKSILAKIISGGNWQFQHTCIAAYMLCLFQPAFALWYALPWPLFQDPPVDYTVGCDDRATGRSYKFNYRTIYTLGNATNHGSVLMVISTLMRMDGVTFQDLEYAKRRMNGWLMAKAKAWQVYYWDNLLAQLVRAVSKFIIVGLLQNAVQANLQTSLLGINYEITGEIDSQMILSVVLCFIGTLGDFPDASEIIQLAAIVIRGTPEEIEDESAVEASIPSRAYNEGDTTMTLQRFQNTGEHIKSAAEKVAHLKWSIRWKLAKFTLMMCAYLALTIWSVAKMIAIFVCPHHLWNVSLPWNYMAGCSQG